MKLFDLILLFSLMNYVSARSQQLVITNVNVVDVKSGSIQQNVSVIIDGERIVGIRKENVSNNGQIVDGKGKYLIPGLWDMHTHNWNSENFFPLLLANGVTGIRDMFGQMENITHWRSEIASGKIPGPVIIASGPIVDGPNPIWPGSVAVKNPEEVPNVIDSLKNKLKVDFIKVYSLLTRPAYFKISEESKRQGISFAGHVPNGVSVLEAARSGQKSQEHLMHFVSESSDSAAHILKVSRKEIIDTTLKDRTSVLKLQLKTFNPKKLENLITELAKYDTWICPTLTVNRNLGYLTDTPFTHDPRVNYMMSGIKNIWNPKNDFRFKSTPAEYYTLKRKEFDLHLKIVKLMHAKGIKLLAGTDYPNPYCFPGFSLHDELQLMTQAGLTPFQALQTATINPAIFLELTNDYGSVEVGKIANLVLLNKNPLKDINNTKSIYGLILKGKYINEKSLQEMLQNQWHK